MIVAVGAQVLRKRVAQSLDYVGLHSTVVCMMRLARMWGAWTCLAIPVLYSLLATTAAAAKSNLPESNLYVVRSDHWSEEDERGYQKFIAAIGESDCGSLDECLHSKDNPFFGSDPPSRHFTSDCADLPYVLRFYYAWKRGLPFSYVDAVAPRDGSGEDIRYSKAGNKPISRRDIPSGRFSGYQLIDQIRDAISTATYRIHPDIDSPVTPDLYAPAITPAAIHPGTMVYDPAGHVAIVYRVDPDGQVHSFDAHTDFSLTQITFDVRFARTRPAQGSGFKNWRPMRLVGAERQLDGSYRGGHVVVAKNTEIADFSIEQFYGTGKRPKDEAWASGAFSVNGEKLDYYDFVRARLAGGKLVFDPVREVRDMTASLCSDLQYRVAAVALAAPLAQRPHPDRLPRNIYGTDGDWEMYSTPSRDARLKTAFKHLRDMAQRFVELNARKDTKHLASLNSDLPDALLKAYRQASESCAIIYRKSDGSSMSLSFEEARQRLFTMSFDPYHCPERRWGASDTDELASCREGPGKESWYAAEQPLRNQIERSYDARMDFTLQDLQRQKATVAPPDTDVVGYLERAGKQARN